MLNFNILSLLAIPILFAIIHFIEFSSYYCRIAGLKTGIKVLSYSYQQMFFVGTRFFFIALMPLIGFIVDRKIPTNDYIFMLHMCMLLAGSVYIISFMLRDTIIKFIEGKLLLKVESNYSSVEFRNFSYFKMIKNKKIIFLSSIVFCCYALGVFLSFYYALVFYEYRATIGQLSGVVNGLATVLLTFIIEPLLAKEIDDNNPEAINMVFALLFGRFIGVSVITHLIIMVI